MQIDEKKIRRHLRGELGCELAIYDAVDSTNNAAKLLAKNGAPHGAVLLARRQTAGKGRLGRSFYSPTDAGIYLSVILRPKATRWELLTPAAAVAVSRAIQTACELETKIKWVNDVYCQGKKLCGILAESSIGRKGMDYVVLGIGVNVNQSAFPPELRESATSLEEAGVLCDVNRLTAEILNKLDICIQEEFLEEYRERSCVLGKQIRIFRGREVFDGMAVEIDDEAHLVVETQTGERITLSCGEVTIRGNFV